jgi:hypothetical protein
MHIFHVENDAEFKDWVKWVFDREVENPEWFHRISYTDVPYPDEEAIDILGDAPWAVLQYYTRIFRQANELLEPYTDEQIYQGLYNFPNHGLSFKHGLSIHDQLVNPEIDISIRRDFVMAEKKLFLNFFARRLPPFPVDDADNADEGLLAGACFMWWDVVAHHIRIVIDGQDPAPDELRSFLEWCTEALIAQLGVRHQALWYSAIHGLGHFHHYKLVDASPIIKRWLKQTPDIPKNVYDYALQVSTGISQ